MQFSVLATSYNDENNIQRFLDSFEKQSLRPDYIVIVDGGSNDKIADKIRDISSLYHFSIQFYDHVGRLNIAQGYNWAIRKCNTEIMIMAGIGNDYSNNFCEDLIQTYKELSTDIVYTRIIGNMQNSFSRAFNIVFVGGKEGKIYPGASNRGALISKTVYERTGLFYEKFIYAGEDGEYFDRVKRMGLKMTCCKDAIVYWDTPTTFKEYLHKSKVNAIADLQIVSADIIVKHILIRAILLLFIIGASFIKWWFSIILMGLLCLLIFWKQKSISIRALLLRLHFIFLPSYYYLKLWRYTKLEYHFDDKDVPIFK